MNFKIMKKIKRNKIIYYLQLLVMLIGFGSPILAMLLATKGYQYAIACTICMFSVLYLFILEQYKK